MESNPGAKTPYKRGRLNHEEMDYIRKNIATEGPDVISEKLNRSPDLVEDFAKREGIAYDYEKTDESIVQAGLNKNLRESIEWQALTEELTEQELNYFAHRYAKFMSQFTASSESVLATEEAQIFQLIRFEILMQRNLKATKRSETDIRRMEKELTKIFDQYAEDDMPDQVRADLLNIENQILAARAANNSKSSELVKLQDKYAALMKDLKATRDQRITKIENSSKDVIGLLKAMQDRNFRAAEGKQQALVSLALDKEMKRLSEYHTYEDGVLDRPILSADTISEDD